MSMEVSLKKVITNKTRVRPGVCAISERFGVVASGCLVPHGRNGSCTQGCRRGHLVSTEPALTDLKSCRWRPSPQQSAACSSGPSSLVVNATTTTRNLVVMGSIPNWVTTSAKRTLRSRVQFPERPRPGSVWACAGQWFLPGRGCATFSGPWSLDY